MASNISMIHNDKAPAVGKTFSTKIYVLKYCNFTHSFHSGEFCKFNTFKVRYRERNASRLHGWMYQHSFVHNFTTNIKENSTRNFPPMGSSKIEYVETTQMYATNYARNSKAIGVLWGIFTICYAIIVAVAFATPEWLANTVDSDNPARFGLWSNCFFTNTHNLVEDCRGTLDTALAMENVYFKWATLFGAIAVVISVVAILTLTLLFCVSFTKILYTCAWMQLISGICLIVCVVVFPIGWDSDDIRKTCGSKANRFMTGECSIRWAYQLACVACLDAIVLAILAFILASRRVKLQPDPMYGTLRKGEMNAGYMGSHMRGDTNSIAGSRKSLNLHPVLMMPQPGIEMDRFSEMSARSKNSMYRPPDCYASSIHNFQL